jgi:hypothetical protein
MKFRCAFIPIAILTVLLGCRASKEPVVVPSELHGIWKTEDSRYEGRSFELRADTIILALGEEGKESYPIETLEKRQELRGTLYVLTYRNLIEGFSDSLLFYFEPREGGLIRFKNQMEIEWKKEGP